MLADLLTIAGFVLLIAGLWLAFSLGYALIAAGALVMYAGACLQTAPVKPIAPVEEAAS